MKPSKYDASTFARDPSARPGACVIVEDGVACAQDAMRRGVCPRHAYSLQRVGRLNELALPVKNETAELRPYRDAPAGACRVLVAGEPCPTPARGQSGLCVKHYARIHQAHRLGSGPPLASFAADYSAATYSRNPDPEAGVCVACTHLPGSQFARAGLRHSCADCVARITGSSPPTRRSSSGSGIPRSSPPARPRRRRMVSRGRSPRPACLRRIRGRRQGDASSS